MRRIARALVPTIMVLSVLFSACASGAGSSTGPIAHPAGDDLVLRVEYRGGFLAPGFLLTSFPTFTMTGDGRVIVPGAQVDLFPGPALPAENERRLTAAGIQTVLKELARTGLFAASVEYRGAENFVADASDTVFTLHADGRDVVVTVYALGLLDPTGSNPGISEAELAAYGTLTRVVERLGNLDAWVPAGEWADASWHAYQPNALRLLVRNADADPPDESGIRNLLLDWPEASDPAAFGDETADGEHQCAVVSGQEAQDWYALLSGANQLTRFVKGDHRYEVTVRFQLPDEPLECPQPAA